ncbi:MAG: hypothetical protein A2729_02475 [Candidatus Buchananbacteria bacterium RIFCSPHIGHO2_01_FULL_39_14]|uniref:Uncharacterized protein n=1 Tax=Candidatus Buchananbacteria bacterium RIFCSPHIGHO2_01_FULL_39_14 TaxID=1797532 RepID=A0A1G1XUJ5_9BACT|nr:MAG: hypothetical protein A2729_02475 [Candidatus Buchananbacteria bacterium RIFCSPHIGHO2_01_FULL_39_14]
MFLTVHAAGAIVVSQFTTNPLLAFLVGMISHLVLDLLPHGDQVLIENKSFPNKSEVLKIKKLAATDVIAMFIVLSLLYWFGFLPLSLVIFMAVFGSILPDFITGVYILKKFRWLKSYVDFKIWLHYVFNNFTVSLKTGLIIQLIFLIGFLLLIIF